MTRRRTAIMLVIVGALLSASVVPVGRRASVPARAAEVERDWVLLSDCGQEGTFPLCQRVRHTATPLSDGTILFVGGTATKTAVRYGPDTQPQWTPTAPTDVRRVSGFTTTLLTNDHVLVVGGNGADGALSSAEVYNGESWEETRPLFTVPDKTGTGVRHGDLNGHTATRLDGGRCASEPALDWCGDILVAGGVASNKVQIYDSEDGWRPARPMNQARRWATATLLNDGRVLVVGGTRHEECQMDAHTNGEARERLRSHCRQIEGRSAEVYDPATDAWTETPTLPAPATAIRGTDNGPSFHTATLLGDGNVLITGGVSFGQNGEFIGGSDQAQMYDPETNEWTLVAAMSERRMRGHSATLLDDDSVLVAGGGPDEGEGDVARTAEVYVSGPGGGEWTEEPEMKEPRRGHTATRLATGAVLVVGGEKDANGSFSTLSSYEVLGADPRPSVAALSPGSGRVTGGTRVTISGSGFEGDVQALFGTQPALSTVVKTPNEVIAVAPPRAAGPVDVVVTTTAGGSTRRSEAPEGGAQVFRYVEGASWAPAEAPVNFSRGPVTLLGKGACAGAAPPPTCGLVLVAGGDGRDPRSAELFDPATSSWRPTGPMIHGRQGHSATLLEDGRVLVVGGRQPEGSGIGAAELYDPASETWAPAGQLTVARHGHTATAVAGGRVLVAGGKAAAYDVPRPLDSVEVFDPATTRWSPAPPLLQGRTGHSATRLASGMVLFAGGENQDGSLASSELYDPVTGISRGADALESARAGHTATALGDGSVLIVGGSRQGGLLVASAERFRPPTAATPTGTWTSAGRLASGRSGHTATLTDGRVVVAGGTSEALSRKALASTELYDPDAGPGSAWAPALAMLSARIDHGAVALSGPACARPRAAHRCDAVVVVGGSDTEPVVEVLDDAPLAPTIARVEPPAGPTFGETRVTLTGAGLFGRQVAVRLGEVAVPDASLRFVAEDEISFDTPSAPQGTLDVVVTVDGRTSRPSPAARFTYGSGAWDAGGTGRARGDACRARARHTATALGGGQVLFAGGTPNVPIVAAPPLAAPEENSASKRGAAAPFASTDLYDPGTGRCTAATGMANPRFDHSATRLTDGTVLVVGGQDARGAALASAERYFPPTAAVPGGTWKSAGTLSRARFSHTATLLPDGRVLVAGGSRFEDYRGQATATTEIYDPEDEQWSTGPPMAAPRVNHTATLLADGSVLVAGGLGPPVVLPPAVADALVELCRTQGPTDEPVSRTADAANRKICTSDAVALASAERFRPTAGSWDQTEPMAVARYDHTATVLAGEPCAVGSPPAWCGSVLVAGGAVAGAVALRSAEVYDPRMGTWAATGLLVHAREGHVATSISGGRVLVAGSGPRFPGEPVTPSASAEVYLPARRVWVLTATMVTGRAAHAAAVLPGGDILVSGGYRAPAEGSVKGKAQEINMADPPVEVYTPAPLVTGVVPGAIPAGAETPVSVVGTGLARAQAVQVAGAQAPAALTRRTEGELSVVAPARAPGIASVAVVGPGGTSATFAPQPAAELTYLGLPGAVAGLVAEAGAGEVELRFSPALASADAPELGVARNYEVRQAGGGPAGLAGAPGLCGMLCRNLGPQGDGAIHVRVTDVEPGTYSYTVRAVNEAGLPGPFAPAVTVSVGGETPEVCPAPPVPAAHQLVYPGGRYALISLPGNTVVHADSPLYSWSDQGAGGRYTSEPGTTPVQAGRGYWAWFACPRLVEMPVPDVGGVPVVTLPLGGYHASMVGNPSATAPATVVNQDFAARWVPEANGGAGAYDLSGYRQASSLAVGEGVWVFSYVRTEIHIEVAR